MISIDPGEQGAIVRWDDGVPKYISDMSYKGKRLDIVKLMDAMGGPHVTVIEDVHTAPRAGVSSSGNFMYNVGVLHAAANYCGSTLVLLRPQLWKAAVGLYGKPKSQSPLKACELFADIFFAQINPYKNRIDRAEALLIGWAYLKLKKAGKEL